MKEVIVDPEDPGLRYYPIDDTGVYGHTVTHMEGPFTLNADYDTFGRVMGVEIIDEMPDHVPEAGAKAPSTE